MPGRATGVEPKPMSAFWEPTSRIASLEWRGNRVKKSLGHVGHVAADRDRQQGQRHARHRCDDDGVRIRIL